MKHMKLLIILTAITTYSLSLSALEWVKKPTLQKAQDKWVIEFELNDYTDVEVAILDSKGNVLRHLVAGLLGEKAIAPFQANSKSQKIEWDGKDDFGETLKDSKQIKLRVRAGLNTSLEQIVGGEPYAFYSKEMGQGDHSCWRIKGLEAKPDGKVYIVANINTYGPGAIRAFEANGTYAHTVYPPPAGKPLESVINWGAYQKEDGSYNFKYNDMGSPALSKTPITGHRGKLAFLISSTDQNSLSLIDESSTALMTINTDGTLAKPIDDKSLLVNEPSMVSASPRKERIFGEIYTCLTPDNKSMLLTGLYYATLRGWSSRENQITDNFWRDGRIYKVDLETRKASIFFELPTVLTNNKDRDEILGDTVTSNCSAFHGITTDADGNIFVCDRQNKRILILDKNAKIVKEIPALYPDAIAVSKNSKQLFVTTRIGSYHNTLITNNKNYELKLLKFDDWTKDEKPSFEKHLCTAGMFPGTSYLSIAQSKAEEFLWVAYNVLTVQVYKTTTTSFELIKDFNEETKQQGWDFQYIEVDRLNEHIYIGDGFGQCFRIKDWKNPRVESLTNKEGGKINSIDLTVDHRNRALFVRSHGSRETRRYLIDNDLNLIPDEKVTLGLSNDWRISLGFGTRGADCAPNGDLATLGSLGKNDYSGPLIYWHKTETTPWSQTAFDCLGEKPSTGGVQFDLHGNLYVGLRSRKDPNQSGKILKFKATGKPADGKGYFPTAPNGPDKTYDIPYGPFAGNFTRTPRFAVDDFGRIYAPDGLNASVMIADNEGNPIHSFGTYGNIDSKGGLKDETVTTKDIPMAWPNSVAVTDDYIYVGDIVNTRLLRIKKNYTLEVSNE